MKLECRWCGKKLEQGNLINGYSSFYIHEQVCLDRVQGLQVLRLTNIAKTYKDYQVQWSITQAKRWRTLPGKGWQALDNYPMVEFLGKVDKQ